MIKQPLRLSTKVGAERIANQTRVPLFYIDDTEYTIPNEVDMVIALRYAEVTTVEGQEAALVGLFKEVVGEEAWAALLAYKGMAKDELIQLLESVNEHVMGALQEAQGK